MSNLNITDNEKKLTLELKVLKKYKPDNFILFTPARVLVLGFASVILLGTMLLMLPEATVDGLGLSFLNALFTATSAVCVTGLVVVDTGTTLTMLGQLFVISMIQIGGLGFMTFATLFTIMLGRRVTLRERLLLQEALNENSVAGVVRLTKYIIAVTFTIEGIGALILAIRWSFDMHWKQAVYFGIFHSVSAFNNAGFDLFGNFSSLTKYVGDPVVNITIIGLIILGGLGFVVISDVYSHRQGKLTLHTKLVLKFTAGLILFGALAVFALEYTNPKTLAGLDPVAKILASLFQSVTPRTAGYNTLDIGSLRMTTLLIIITLMFIGASPGSTGGGIKTTSLASLVLYVVSLIKGKESVSYQERTIPKEAIQKAVVVIFLSCVFVLTITVILTITDSDKDFLKLLFETTSAFGTVGLTTGITPSLSSLGKTAIIFTMYCGRVGLLTLVLALAQKRATTKTSHIKYPDEKIMIG